MARDLRDKAQDYVSDQSPLSQMASAKEDLEILLLFEFRNSNEPSSVPFLLRHGVKLNDAKRIPLDLLFLHDHRH